jgi:hypothetical protein
MRLFIAAVFGIAAITSQMRKTVLEPKNAKAAVERIYHDEAWLTKAGQQKGIDVLSAAPEVMATYLDAGLVRAVVAVRACQQRTHGECSLSFDPVWDSQDPTGSTVRVVATASPSIVRALIHHAYANKTTVVTYHLRHTTVGWRVTDMGGRAWPSLLGLLRRPVR